MERAVLEVLAVVHALPAKCKYANQPCLPRHNSIIGDADSPSEHC